MYAPKPANMCGALLIALAFLLLGCSERPDVVPQGQAMLVAYSHSDTCVADVGNMAAQSDTADVEVIVDGLQVTVIHKNAILNCCLDSILVSFTQENSILKLEETEVASNPCYCLCPFEVTARIEVSFPGAYVIEIWTEGTLAWRGEVAVEGSRHLEAGVPERPVKSRRVLD